MEDFVGNEQLISKDRLREYNQRTNLRGWVQVSSHLGAILLAGYALSLTWDSYWGIIWFVTLGILLNFLYAGQHELSHWTVFRTRNLNNVFGHLFGFIVFMPRESDRMEHYQHHRYTQNPELDGELQGDPYFTTTSYLLYVTGLSYWPRVLWRIVRAAFTFDSPKFFVDKQKKLAAIEGKLYLAGYAIAALLSWYYQSWFAVSYWIAPMFITKIFHQSQNLTEHTGMPNESDILINTRTIKSNPILNWLAWNMPYHTAHHTYPAVPFYKLPALHAEMVENMGHEPETMSYLSFQWHMLRKVLQEGTSKYTGKQLDTY
jgi:fatty acid desaturase